MDILSAIKHLDLHDATLETLHFHFEERRIEMQILGDVSREQRVMLHFMGVSNLIFGEFAQAGAPDVEIYSVDITELTEDLYHARFMTLLGPSMPSWEFSFQFTDVSMGDIGRRHPPS